ncbi:cobaltochelatase subunit CobN [Prosthecochloris sp. SCSIO W1101]|nr:cobaltochelatase subunit CobN [Prosthecochloris sp. SCSIO W1101]UZJ40160.1 cobaltochelatase subunit CobN [Prosthecochloris sp. SCSIO W1101]
MKDHGFQGAQGVAGRINTLFKWSATTREVEPWVFDSVVETYVCNEELREWMREQNPYALEEITRRLLEAEARGLWNADEELLEAVRSAALLLEGDLEERIGDVAEDFQGARVDVFTSKEVEKWKMEWKMSGKKEGPS